MNNEPRDSSRKPPQERFAETAIAIDLRQSAEELAQEPHGNRQGHQQIALYKHGSATLALFRFQQGGSLPAHKAAGTVIIQVLEGALTVATGETRQHLSAGQLLILAPNVPHDVFADEQSLMLLTVSLEHP